MAVAAVNLVISGAAVVVVVIALHLSHGGGGGGGFWKRNALVRFRLILCQRWSLCSFFAKFCDDDLLLSAAAHPFPFGGGNTITYLLPFGQH